jgi:hypothetical protein
LPISLVATIVLGLDEGLRSFGPMILGAVFFGPPLSVIGFITSRGRTRYITAVLTATTFMVYGGVAYLLL